MGNADGFAYDLSVLRQLGGQLADHAEQARSLAEALGAITADTGRPDSDEMGRIGPGAVAELVGILRGKLMDDSGNVDACAALYAKIDDDSDRQFSTIMGWL